jgi:hypothetical protein
MRRNFIFPLILALAGVVFDSLDAAAACTVPNNLTNGQIADATQVMANLNALLRVRLETYVDLARRRTRSMTEAA